MTTTSRRKTCDVSPGASPMLPTTEALHDRHMDALRAPLHRTPWRDRPVRRGGAACGRATDALALARCTRRIGDVAHACPVRAPTRSSKRGDAFGRDHTANTSG